MTGFMHVLAGMMTVSGGPPPPPPPPSPPPSPPPPPPPLDAISMTAWSDISFTWPVFVGTNEDRTLTWSVGGARTISATLPSAGTLLYRINSGSWVEYTVPFAFSSGQTLGWRFGSGGDEFTYINVTDDTRSALINSFFVASFFNP